MFFFWDLIKKCDYLYSDLIANLLMFSQVKMFTLGMTDNA